MKLGEIKNLCKKSKSIVLCSKVAKDGAKAGEPIIKEQWLSDGKGYFLLKNCPKFTEENIYTVFDITDGDKYTFIDRNLKELPYNFYDEDYSEKSVTISKIYIKIAGKEFATAYTSLGAILIDVNYFKPFQGLEPSCEIFERKQEDEKIYFVVKHGLFVIGVIVPQTHNVNNFYEEFIKLSKELEYSLRKQSREKTKSDKDPNQLIL